MPKPICLVTGGAGFIGSHIAQGALNAGMRVRILDNFATGKMEHIEEFASDVELIKGSILNERDLKEAMGGVTYVSHQAAIRSVSKSMEYPGPSNETNVTGTLKVLEAAKAAGVKMVAYASSSSLYGDCKTFPQREDMCPLPMSPYAVSKVAGEFYCRVFAKSFGLPTVSMRYFNVYGPKQDPESIYSAVIPRFMELALNNEPLQVHWDGKQSRDFTYVGDVVAANLACFKAPEAAYGEAVNIAGGKVYSLLDLIKFLETTMKRKLKVEFHPKRAGDVRKTYANISKAKKLLGYKPKTNFQQGLAEAWKYFSKAYAVHA